MSFTANNNIEIFRRELLTIKIFPSVGQMSAAAAGDVAATIIELLKNCQTINMLFASAPSQDEFLNYLVKDTRIEWRRINAFHLDEYIGLPPTAPQCFGNYLRNRIFEKVAFRSVNYMNGMAADIDRECNRYADLLIRNPPDIVCLGIGENGHIAFNDPEVADFNDPKSVKIVALDRVCRQQQVNEGCFSSFDQVPATAMTVTIPALLKTGRVFCVVPFRSKADAVFNALWGEVSEKCPASILRKKKNSCLYLDNESAQRIKSR